MLPILQEHLKERAVAYAKNHTPEETTKKFSVSSGSLSKWLKYMENSHLCEYCTKTFSDRYNLERHVRETHWTFEERQNYVNLKKIIPITVLNEEAMGLKESNDLYGKTYLHDEVMLNNIKAKEEQRHEDETQIEDMTKCLDTEKMQSIDYTKCVYCLKNVQYIVRHIIFAHKNVKQFFCDLCDFRATIKNSIRSHMEEEHKSAVFVCPICANRCQLRDDLNKHMIKNHLGSVNQND